MKILKSIFVLLLLACLTIGTWIAIGSTDQPSYDDQGLLSLITPVPDHENGFRELAYTHSADFAGIPTGGSGEVLASHARQETWDQAAVDQILKAHQFDIQRVLLATKYNRFRFPTPENVIEDFPDYLQIINAFRILLVSSMNEAKASNMDQAVFLAGKAAHFTQQVKTEENFWLLSHMVGLAMQHEALSWAQQLASQFVLNTAQYTALAQAIENMPSYENDSFGRVFAGEFRFSVQLTSDLSARDFSERWDDWKLNNDWWNANLTEYGEFSQLPAPERVWQLLQVFFPRYVLHQNAAAAEAAKLYTRLAGFADKHCSQIAFLNELEPYSPSWIDIFKPNSMAKAWSSTEQQFAGYYVRRCFAHAHLESTRAIIAIKRYQAVNGALPKSLHDLVPLYLDSLPIDPFNGETLGYSSDDAWLYSVGTNFSDDGGSDLSRYIWRCEHDDACKASPTFAFSTQMTKIP